MTKDSKLTGYPSIDKPWLKYYSEEAINAPIPECTIYEYLYFQNKNHLKDYTMNYFGKRMTYKSLFDNIDKAANGFKSIGVKQGDTVTIFSTNTPETIYCIFALNKIGAVINLEYITLPPKEALSAIQKCNSKTVVILDALLPRYTFFYDCCEVDNIVLLPTTRSMPSYKKVFANLKLKSISFGNALRYSEFVKNGNVQGLINSTYTKNSPAVIVHSGGTTGVPKGVVLTNDNLVYLVWAFQNNKNDFARKDKYLGFIPPFHAFGLVMGTIVPLCIGMECILSMKFDEQILINLFIKNKPNHIMVSGTHIPKLISDSYIKKMNLSFFKTCGFGGTPLNRTQETELVEFLKSHNSIAKASVGYGMSELASAISAEVNWYYGKVGSTGIPLCKANVKVIDTDDGKELMYEQEGELCFSSPGVMLEYLKNETETQKTIFYDENGAKWLHSGDLGYVDKDGFVFITGRIKRIYSTKNEKNGTLYKIFPDYVTDMIHKVKGVNRCAVVCIPNEEYKHIAIAFVVLQKDCTNDIEKRIYEYLEKNIAVHNIPKKIVIIENIPLTPIGKPDYLKLKKEAIQFFEKEKTK